MIFKYPIIEQDLYLKSGASFWKGFDSDIDVED